MTHLFCSWEFVPINFSHLFHSSPYTLFLAITCLLSVSMNLFLFCYVSSFDFFFFLDSMYKQNHMVFVFLSDLFPLA